MKFVKKVLLFSCVVLIPIQDCGLQATWLKGVAATPAFLPLLALIGISILERLWWADLALPIKAIWATLYALSITSVYYLLGEQIVLGSSVFKKSCAFALLALFLSALVWVVDYRDEGLLRTAVNIAFVITVLGILVGDFNLFGLQTIVQNSWLHFTPITDPRPRGFCTESSTLSVQIAAIGFLVIHYAQTKIGRITAGIAGLALLIVTGSKGAVLVLLLCSMLLVVMRYRFTPSGLALGLLIVPVGFIASMYITATFGQTNALVEYTSVSTRITMALWVFVTIAHNPLGVGFSGFLRALVKYLPVAITTVRDYSPVPLNFSEVASYLSSADDAGTKTLLLDYTLFFGVPFLIAFTTFNIRLVGMLRAREQTALVMTVLFISIAISTYAGLPSMYEVPLAYGIALNEIRKFHNSCCVA